MQILAVLTAVVELLKKAGIIRDRQQEADIQAAFLNSTSGPLYAIARIVVVFASLWDLFLNQGQMWKATGLPLILEYLPVLWLFIGPAIVPFAEAALKVSLKSPSVNPPSGGGISATKPTPPTQPEPPVDVPEAPVLGEYEVRMGPER